MGEKEGKKHQCATETLINCLSHTPNRGSGPRLGMCPDLESNQQPFGSQVGTQSTETHQPWLTLTTFKCTI